MPPDTAIGVWLNAGNTQTIAAGTVERPGTVYNALVNARTNYGSVFGPEFGGRLNVYGTLNFDWVVAAVQFNPANRSLLNMYGGSVVTGVNLAIGNTWWYQGGPYATANLYSNAQASIEFLWWGGHVNVYDISVLTILGGVADVDGGIVSDVTRTLNLGGGKLILPSGYNVAGLITRGVLLAYGKHYATNDFIITDQGTNILVATVPLGGPLQNIHFQPVPNLMAGSYYQAILLGGYPGANVDVTPAEPGVDPGTLPGTAAYHSSNTNIVTVSSNGLLHAIHAGTATLSATLGSFSTNTTVIVTPTASSLVHRYSFNEAAGSTAADSVGGVSWDGTLVPGATFTGAGQVTLDGLTGYVMLPSGVVTGMDAVTIEAWVTFGSPLNTWSALYSFGNQNSSGQPVDYISMYARTGTGAAEVNFGIGAGTANLELASSAQPLDGLANAHIVAVHYPLAGYLALYTNGVLAAATANTQNYPLLYQSIYNISSLNRVLSTDVNNIIGASFWAGDPFVNATIDEFRIYNGPLTAAQIKADRALGPNQLIGSNTSVSLSAALSGSNLVLTWPTNSALVNLTSTSNLGSGGAWPSVNQPLTIASGKYQVTVPVAGSAQYFRLEK